MQNRLALLSLLLLTFLCTCVSAQSILTNDDLADAIVFDLPGDLPQSHTVFATQIVNATAEMEEATCLYSRSWWYAFTPTATDLFIMRAFNPGATVGSIDTDVVLGVYTGDGHPLGEVICSDNDDEPGDGERVILQLSEATTYYFRVTVPDGAMTDGVTFSITPLENIWLGAINDDWYEPDNWSRGRIPFQTDRVILPAGTPNCTLSGGTVTIESLEVAQDLTIEQPAELKVTDAIFDAVGIDEGAELNVQGQLTVDAAGGDGITIVTGLLNIAAGGQVSISEPSEDAFQIIDSLYVAGSLTVTDVGATGLYFRDGAMDVAETGVIDIQRCDNKGVQVRNAPSQWDGPSFSLAGTLLITDCADDGIDMDEGSFLVGPTGVIDVLLCDIGFNDVTFVNEGNISIGASTGDGLNTGGDCTNRGTITVLDSGIDGVDISDGTTFFNEGTLTVNNAAETLIDDGTFQNEGELFVDGIIGSTTVFLAGSELNPGQSPGCVTFTTLGLDLSGTDVRIELDGTSACSDFDQIRFSGSSLDVSMANLVLDGSYAPQLGDEFLIVNYDGASFVMGEFAGLPNGGSVPFNGVEMMINYFGGDGNDIVLTATSVLPVELLSFAGEALGKNNVLTWTSVREEAFSHYAVERSSAEAGAQRPDSSAEWWQDLGAVAGAGEVEGQGTVTSPLSPGVRSYTFTDATPFSQNYYRLRMIDLDGTFSYSPIVRLDNPLGDSANSADELSVFPNPNDGTFQLALPEVEGELNLALYTIHGTRVRAQKIGAGTTNWRMEDQLPYGIYLVSVTALNGERWTKRVVVR